MEPTDRPVETLSNRYPDAESVGEHLVIDKTDWVPGEDPEPHRRHPGQTGYFESFFRCIQCGEERLAKRDFPDTCDGGR